MTRRESCHQIGVPPPSQDQPSQQSCECFTSLSQPGCGRIPHLGVQPSERGYGLFQLNHDDTISQQSFQDCFLSQNESSPHTSQSQSLHPQQFDLSSEAQTIASSLTIHSQTLGVGNQRQNKKGKYPSTMYRFQMRRIVEIVQSCRSKYFSFKEIVSESRNNLAKEKGKKLVSQINYNKRDYVKILRLLRQQDESLAGQLMTTLLENLPRENHRPYLLKIQKSLFRTQ